MSGVPAVVRLSNDIARQFETVGPEQGARLIAEHLQSFWDPRMLTELRSVAARRAESLDPLVLSALTKLA